MKQPLAEQMRPATFDEVVGQEHLLEQGGALRVLLDAKTLPSIVFWGPPGTGKTTMARLLAQKLEQEPVYLSAVMSGVQDLRKVFAQAQGREQPLILFIDEIHRFNKSQQDALLQPLESGEIILIGATTENPSFALNNALLSRVRVLVLNSLSADQLTQLALRALEKLGIQWLNDEMLAYVVHLCDGDGRRLFNMLETLKEIDPHPETLEALAQVLQKRVAFFDKSEDFHYNLISALIKSMRGSDPQAALYWMARLLEGGEDPLYLARRLIRFAVEDIGLADPQALVHAQAVAQAFERLGSPEGELAIANSVVYLATAPKSNAVYKAFKAVQKDVATHGSLMPPKHILNAPTKLMAAQGYGQNYVYDHDAPDGFSGQNYFPEKVGPRCYYHPVERGFEREISKRLTYWEQLRQRRKIMP